MNWLKFLIDNQSNNRYSIYLDLFHQYLIFFRIYTTNTIQIINHLGINSYFFIFVNFFFLLSIEKLLSSNYEDFSILNKSILKSSLIIVLFSF